MLLQSASRQISNSLSNICGFCLNFKSPPVQLNELSSLTSYAPHRLRASFGLMAPSGDWAMCDLQVLEPCFTRSKFLQGASQHWVITTSPFSAMSSVPEQMWRKHTETWSVLVEGPERWGHLLKLFLTWFPAANLTNPCKDLSTLLVSSIFCAPSYLSQNSCWTHTCKATPSCLGFHVEATARRRRWIHPPWSKWLEDQFL